MDELQLNLKLSDVAEARRSSTMSSDCLALAGACASAQPAAESDWIARGLPDTRMFTKDGGAGSLAEARSFDPLPRRELCDAAGGDGNTTVGDATWAEINEASICKDPDELQLNRSVSVVREELPLVLERSQLSINFEELLLVSLHCGGEATKMSSTGSCPSGR